MTKPMQWFCRKSGKSKFTPKDIAAMKATACLLYTSDVRFVVRRVVVLGIARNRLNIRFGHCTSCLFDNSSVKLCKARHAVAVRTGRCEP